MALQKSGLGFNYPDHYFPWSRIYLFYYHRLFNGQGQGSRKHTRVLRKELGLEV